MLVVDDWSIEFQFRLIERENPPWYLYGAVWEWLHTQLAPDTILKRTAVSIAEAVSIERRVNIDHEQAGGILRAMHSKGLIEARPVEAGTPIDVDAVALEASGRDLKLQPAVRGVAEGLWSGYVSLAMAESPPPPDLRKLAITVNKRALKETLHISSYLLDKALTVLVDRGVNYVGETYTGNQIRLLMWRADLDQHPSKEKIEAKRELDLNRLRAVVTFTKLLTEDARNAFLRQYFLSAVEA